MRESSVLIGVSIPPVRAATRHHAIRLRSLKKPRSAVVRRGCEPDGRVRPCSRLRGADGPPCRAPPGQGLIVFTLMFVPAVPRRALRVGRSAPPWTAGGPASPLASDALCGSARSASAQCRIASFSRMGRRRACVTAARRRRSSRARAQRPADPAVRGAGAFGYSSTPALFTGASGRTVSCTLSSRAPGSVWRASPEHETPRRDPRLVCSRSCCPFGTSHDGRPARMPWRRGWRSIYQPRCHDSRG